MALTRGDLLKLLEREAKGYCGGVLDSVRRNCHMNNLTEADIAEVQRNPRLFRRFAEAVLVDFVNYVGAGQRLDYGLKTSHLKPKR
ncbi:MAG: hypothetical protein UW85_C0018G0006 [Parcubacteria group bacterium GW2011_GWA1_Parcubacteria_45_10]|nr:MAG: hypothetical protein UW85_C0018G0006 [Parcubacteria group bacterium GW2011_GWA1_Parcubacteria_45_10]